MNKIIVIHIGIALVFVTGCAPLAKTGNFVWNVPGKVVSGIGKTGKFVWNAPGKVVSGIAETSKFVWHVTPKSVPQLKETAKFIWGSSTKSLENARDDALVKTYHASFNDCYEAVLALGREKRVYIDYRNVEEDSTEGNEEVDVNVPVVGGYFDVFIKNRKKRLIVVMGIKGNVDTTEAGIFFTQPTSTTVKLEVSSLSSNAKRNVAEIVFNELDLRFSAVE